MGLINLINFLFGGDNKNSNPKNNGPIDISEYNSVRYDAVCPTCQDILNVFPVRSKNCKKCKSRIIRVKLPETDLIVLLNESEGEKLKTIVDNYYEEKYQNIKKENPFYVENEKDYSLKLKKALSEKDFSTAKNLSLYYRNLLLDEVEDVSSKNPKIFDIAFNIFRYEISETNKVVIISKIKLSTNVANCKKENLNNKTYEISKFLIEKPIPCIDCTANPVYSCCINPFFD